VLDMRNCLLVEQPNGDFAQTMARQFLFLRLAEAACSTSSPRRTTSRIAAIAAKAVKEVAYHEELAAEWVIRLGDGTDESRRRMVDGLDWMWRFTPELFEADEVAADAAQRGLCAPIPRRSATAMTPGARGAGGGDARRAQGPAPDPRRPPRPP
jgi:ring-1,2-phenylacetyl-CoA epoxidase subunit PaaC